MTQADIDCLKLSKMEFIGWIRLWWHSLWRMLSRQDHRMTSITLTEPLERFPSIKPGTRVVVCCQCEKMFWLHPDLAQDLLKATHDQATPEAASV